MLQPSFTLIYTHHPHSLYVLKTGNGEHCCFVRLPALCILKDEFTMSVSVIKARPVPSTLHTCTLQRGGGGVLAAPGGSENLVTPTDTGM